MLKAILRRINKNIAIYKTTQEDIQWQNEIRARYVCLYADWSWEPSNSTEAYLLKHLSDMYNDVGKSA